MNELIKEWSDILQQYSYNPFPEVKNTVLFESMDLSDMHEMKKE